MATCLYCQFPCETDLFAAEPTLCCSWCQVCTETLFSSVFHDALGMGLGLSPRGMRARTAVSDIASVALKPCGGTARSLGPQHDTALGSRSGTWSGALPLSCSASSAAGWPDKVGRPTTAVANHAQACLASATILVTLHEVQVHGKEVAAAPVPDHPRLVLAGSCTQTLFLLAVMYHRGGGGGGACSAAWLPLAQGHA